MLPPAGNILLRILCLLNLIVNPVAAQLLLDHPAFSLLHLALTSPFSLLLIRTTDENIFEAGTLGHTDGFRDYVPYAEFTVHFSFF